jgi:transposase
MTMAYTTDLTLAQFEVLEALLPKSKTREADISRHLIINAILYQLKNGCQWRDLPSDNPQLEYCLFPVSEVADGWSLGQSFDRVDENGEKRVKKKEYPSLLLGDSMCVKNTDTANIETKGYCHYKSTNGIKRHLLVDVLRNPYFVKCTRSQP